MQINHQPSLKKVVIIGYPVAQSRSPKLHGFWLAEHGIEGTYERLEVLPGEAARAIRQLMAEGYRGCNITVPHKEDAFRACDMTTERASALGSVNTIWFENGVIHGDNTDGTGFVAHLDQRHPGWDAANPAILMLGAGGAARGLALPLLDRNPARLFIANRSPARLETLVSDIRRLRPDAPVDAINWEDRHQALAGAGLIINTTSLGMTGKPPQEFSLETARHDAIIADIVYVPLETPLLASARARGLRTLDGLGMLLHQGVPGFTRWFGVTPRVSAALYDHIAADVPKA